MNLIVDMNGGDLGTSEQGTTRLEQIPFLVMRIGEIFTQIKPRVNLKEGEELSYCFTVRGEYKDTLEKLLLAMENEGLPKGIKFYEADSRKVFDMRGSSGGIVTSVCFYLITKK